MEDQADRELATIRELAEIIKRTDNPDEALKAAREMRKLAKKQPREKNTPGPL